MSEESYVEQAKKFMEQKEKVVGFVKRAEMVKAELAEKGIVIEDASSDDVLLLSNTTTPGEIWVEWRKILVWLDDTNKISLLGIYQGAEPVSFFGGHNWTVRVKAGSLSAEMATDESRMASMRRLLSAYYDEDLEFRVQVINVHESKSGE